MKQVFATIKNNKSNISISLSIVSLLIYLSAYRTHNYDVQITSIYILLLAILFVVDKKSVIFITFILSFFIFLVNRPFIDSLNGVDWASKYANGKVNLSISMLYLSILSLFASYTVFYKGLLNVNSGHTNRRNLLNSNKIVIKIKSLVNNVLKILENNKSTFIFTLLVMYVLTYVFQLSIEIEKYVYMSGKMYQEFYLGYKSVLPSIIFHVGRTNFCFLALILAFLPKKKTTYILLVSFVFLTLPMLLVGQRGSFILALLFSFIYFVLRNFMSNDNEVWIGKYEKILIFVGIPLIVISMGIINDVRHGYSFSFDGILKSFQSFLYKQGITFHTHMLGVQNEEAIYSLAGSKNYLFGDLIGPLMHNKVGRIIFDSSVLPLGNSAIKATEGYWFSHILAFVSHPRYLEGFGYGTSYVVEAYYNYGFTGVILINSFLGYLLWKLQIWFDTKVISRFFSILILESIFYIPRQPFASFFSFLVKPFFFLFIFLIVVLVLITKKFKLDKKNPLYKYIEKF